MSLFVNLTQIGQAQINQNLENEPCAIEDNMQQINEEQKIYSRNIDDLMLNSFVEFDKIMVKPCFSESNSNMNTGDSFFQRSNTLFHSQIVSKDLNKKKKNKKVQCEIGSGLNYSLTRSDPLRYKMRRLEYLKVIQLLKLVFMNLRSSEQKIKNQVRIEIQKTKSCSNEISKSFTVFVEKLHEEIKEKDMKIFQLEQQVDRLLRLNEKLNGKIQSSNQQSKLMINFIQAQKIKSLAEINDFSEEIHQRAEQLQQRTLELQNQLRLQQQQIQNLNEVISNTDIIVKKLQYQNEILTRQNQELVLKNEEIIKSYQLSVIQQEQQCEKLEDNTQRYIRLFKLNESNLADLQNTKKLLKQREDQIYQLNKDFENIILEELNKYQEYFNFEITRVKKQLNSQIFDKNAKIESLKFKEKIYESIILQKQQGKIDSMIFKEKDNNVQENKFIYQDQDEIIKSRWTSSCTNKFMNQEPKDQEQTKASIKKYSMKRSSNYTFMTQKIVKNIGNFFQPFIKNTIDQNQRLARLQSFASTMTEGFHTKNAKIYQEYQNNCASSDGFLLKSMQKVKENSCKLKLNEEIKQQRHNQYFK